MESLLNYLPVLVGLMFAASVALGLIAIDYITGPKLPSKIKSSPYECGFIVEEKPHEASCDRIYIRFIIVAMLFILFDIETIFLYPWAVLFKNLGMIGFIEMISFMAVVMFGLYYIVKKGAFQWD
ncbi:MAG: NADH-quinone oxidoreductase subunit A [Candidatus Wallbacteria bacterium]